MPMNPNSFVTDKLYGYNANIRCFLHEKSLVFEIIGVCAVGPVESSLLLAQGAVVVDLVIKDP